MRVLKIAVWVMGIAIVALVGLLFWKVAEIYGEKSETAENAPAIEQQTVPVTAADAAQTAPVVSNTAQTEQAVVQLVDGQQIVLNLPGELKEISADHGVLLLQVRLEKKRWMAISIDQKSGQVLSRVVLNSQ